MGAVRNKVITARFIRLQHAVIADLMMPYICSCAFAGIEHGNRATTNKLRRARLP